MDLIPYKTAAAFSQYFKSDTWVHSRLSFRMAPIHASRLPGRSSETLNIVKPFSLNLRYCDISSGCVVRQGTHQLAQKSNNTYFPRNEESFMGNPDVSGCVKSLAIC